EEALELSSDNLFITALLEQGFAELEINVGDLSRARTLAERSVQTLRELGEFRSLVAPLLSLARIDLREGSLDDADLLFAECLELSRRYDWETAAWMSIAGIASVAAGRGDLEQAGRLWGALCGIEGPGMSYYPEWDEFDDLSGNSEPDFLRGVEEGRSFSLEAAVAYALSGST